MTDLTTQPRRRTPATTRQVEVAGKAIARSIVQVTNVMVQKAIEGDTKAAEWVASRAFSKDRTVQFEIPPIASAGDAENAIGAVLASVASGKLSVNEGAKLTDIIKAMGETVHMRLVEERLERLEAQQAGKLIEYRRVG
jgi:hypothetical protein